MDYKEIGKMIQNIRKSRNLTQEDLAEKIDSSAGYVSNIETGHKKVGINKLLEIAKALDTTLDVLLINEYNNNDIDKALIAQIELMVRQLNEKQKSEFFILTKKIIEAIKEIETKD